MKHLLEDPLNFISDYYVPVVTKDNFNYIFEGGKPAYHKVFTCDRLNSDYQNFKIPDQIKEKGREAVVEFRQWFKQNSHLMEKPDVFIERIRLKYKIVLNIMEVGRDNSGVEILDNYDLEALEKRIDNLINEAGAYFKNSTAEKQEILRRFQKLTFLAYRNGEIHSNNTRFSDDVLKNFLKQYDIHFKKPIMELLLHYYRVKLNPNLIFEDNLLDQLGFSKCTKCYDK